MDHHMGIAIEASALINPSRSNQSRRRTTPATIQRQLDMRPTRRSSPIETVRGLDGGKML